MLSGFELYPRWVPLNLHHPDIYYFISAKFKQCQLLPKCLQFRFQHPFTSIISGMIGSGKTFLVQSLLQQSSQAIQLLPDGIVWCYSQWQPAYLEMLSTIPQIEFVKGIPPSFRSDFYFVVSKRNLIVLDDQIIDASKDKRIINLFYYRLQTNVLPINE